MVFWATVLSFVMALLYYAMYPASDTIKAIQQPKAEAFISQFFEQHQRAKLYLRNILIALPYTEDIYQQAPDNVDFPTADMRKVLLFDNSFSDYIPSIAKNNIVYDSLYPTYVPEGGDKGLYVSALACLDRKDNDTLHTKGKLIDCQGEYIGAQYLMTYAYVDQQMFGINYFATGNVLWKNAILKRTHGSPECGYLSYNDTENNYYINTSQNITKKIPNALASALEPVFTAAPKDSNEDPMMMFCLSALRRPYEKSQLVVLYDGFLNQMTPLSHNNTATTWANLAGETTANVGGITSWNPTNGPYLAFTPELSAIPADAENGTPAVSGSNSNFVNTNIPQNQLGSTFTISYVVQYNSKANLAYQTLGTSPKNPIASNSVAEIIGGKIDGDTLYFGIKEAGEDSPTLLSTPIVKDKIITVSYAVSAQHHELYINGKSVDEGKLTKPLYSTLTSNDLFIGNDNNQNFKLYNVRINKTKLDASQIEKNHATDAKRFSFKP